MIERFRPGAGGVENVAWEVAHELDRQGETVEVLTREAAPEAAVAITRLASPTFWQPLRIPLFSRRCAAHLRTHDYDVVHGFSHTRTQHLFRAGGGSHLDELRRLHAGLALTSRLASPRHRVRLAIERHVFERTHQHIQCSSRLVADALVRDHGVDASRVVLLPNAVDAERFSGPAAEIAGRALRDRLAPEAARVWLFPGSGWHRKGLDTALDAFATAERDSDAELWVVGRDRPTRAMRRAVRLGVPRRVRFLGPRDDMPALYQAADAVLLPTRYDPFANVTLEAAAAARPIVTTAANGASEWLGDAVTVLADANDGAACAAAMRQLADPAERKRRGEALAARARVLDWPGHVRRLREIYASIVAGRADAAPSGSA